MRRRKVIERLRTEAKARRLAFTVRELTRHTAITVGGTIRTIARHAEIDDVTAHRFWDQFADEFGGKGWWRP